MTAAKLGHGVYTIPEAARLIGLRRSRVRDWFKGRCRTDARHPIFHSDYAPVDQDYAISFLDLIDVFIAGQLREHGVSLQTLRRVYACLQDEFGEKHAFCRRELLTDGKTVFVGGCDDRGRAEIVEVLSRQRVFPRIILPFLETIDYEEVTQLARKWHIDEGIVVDPQISLGQPIVQDVGVPTATLAAAYDANGRNADLVADWFDVHPRHVIAAATFEDRLAA